MISIRKYLNDVRPTETSPSPKPPLHQGRGVSLADAAISGYRAALEAMGRCGSDVCPALGGELDGSLSARAEELSAARSPEAMAAVSENICGQLEEWGLKTARHYRTKVGEVKDMLLMMARTAQSVGERDQRCAQQITAVTAQLRNIGNLEDLTQIRASIEKSATELKNSIDRMTAEGEAVLVGLRVEVSTYQAKCEEAEQLAARDALTRLGNRLWVEGQIESRIKAAAQFCLAILDIDDFKRVNDVQGHLAGDQVLRQFAAELRTACRSTDVLGRWGGDEFIVVLDCGLAEAEAQIGRVSKWVCGNYTIPGCDGPAKLHVGASIGVAEYAPPATMEQLLALADREMYRRKAESRPGAKSRA